jgi:hypothetical protein
MKNIIKPNLFIPGAGKSGTSSLHEYLNLHPDIYMSEKKEPHYFSHDNLFYNEKEKYYSLFTDCANFKYRGESSTGYMLFPNVLERIKSEIDYPKFIFVLRNPIDRCFSHYNWVKSLQAETRRFREAVKYDMNDELDYRKGFGRGYKFYFQGGLYAKYLKKFFDEFGEQNIFIVTTENLRKNRKHTLNSIFDFLELSSMNDIPKIQSNKTKQYNDLVLFYNRLKAIKSNFVQNNKPLVDKLKSISLFNKLNSATNKVPKFMKTEKKVYLNDEDRKWLRSLYAEDVQNLKRITKMNFAEWKDFA